MDLPLFPRSVRIGSLVGVMALSVVLVACGDKKDKAASQTAAKVNKEEITVHQINFLLQQQRGLQPEQAEPASRQILERLIDQELAVQQADALKLDREPRVVQQLEAVKREVLARAYAEKIGENATKPTAEEIKAYYDANPALFSERRVYSLQELKIEAAADQLPMLREKLQGANGIGEFVEFLKASGLRFAGSQAVRSAEQLPLASLKTFARMKDGQAVMNPTPTGAVVILLAGSRMQPVDEEKARAPIEQFLLNERKRSLLEDERKRLRAEATIQYVGKFAEGAPAAPEAAASEPALPMLTPSAEAAPPAGAASTGLDPAAISKGMGLK